jgi:hypothetical protein
LILKFLNVDKKKVVIEKQYDMLGFLGGCFFKENVRNEKRRRELTGQDGSRDKNKKEFTLGE